MGNCKPPQIEQGILAVLYQRVCVLEHARKLYQQSTQDVQELLAKGYFPPDSGVFTLTVLSDGSLKVDVRQK